MTTMREWREKKALSQRDLAKLSGLALSSISHIESGKTKPTFVSRRKIAQALNLKPEDIDFT